MCDFAVNTLQIAMISDYITKTVRSAPSQSNGFKIHLFRNYGCDDIYGCTQSYTDLGNNKHLISVEIASYRDYTNIQQLFKLHKPNHLSKRLLRTGFRHYTI